MNVRVMFYSSTGNTKKLALAIADRLHVYAEAVREEPKPLSAPVDLLLIGSGIYFGKAGKPVMTFIDRLDPAMVKNAAVFATCGGQTRIGSVIKELLQKKGIQVVTAPFVCKGKAWGFINRGRPGDADIRSACDYAEKAVEKLKGNA